MPQSNSTQPSYPCPYCTRVANTAHGFRKHLAGLTRYGGHEMTDNEIALTFLKLESGNVNQTTVPNVSSTSSQLAQPVRSSTLKSAGLSDTSAKQSKEISIQAVQPSSISEIKEPKFNEFNEFFKELLSSLARNKEIPKYQFERRIDTILEMFLPEYLSKKFGGDAEFVVPEFPIKKNNNNQSNNVDFLFYLKRPFAAIDKWLLCELKTDDDSINHEQIQLYSRAKARGMKVMLNDLTIIRNASIKKDKYDILVNRLKTFAPDKPIEIIYFVLSNKDLSGLRTQYPDIEFIGIEELKAYEPVKFPEVWKLFKELIIKN